MLHQIHSCASWVKTFSRSIMHSHHTCLGEVPRQLHLPTDATSLLKEVEGERSRTTTTTTTTAATTTTSSSSSSRWSWCIRCRGRGRWGFCPSGYGAAHSCKAGLTGRSQGAGGASQQPLKGPGPQCICKRSRYLSSGLSHG